MSFSFFSKIFSNTGVHANKNESPNDVDILNNHLVKSEEYFDCDEDELDISDYYVVSHDECEEFFDCKEEIETSKSVSYVIKPVLYTTKYTAQVLYPTSLAVSYVLYGASYAIAVASYVPHYASQALNIVKGKDKSTSCYKVTTASQNALDFTSCAVYGSSYVPYVAGIACKKVSNALGNLDISHENIVEVCDSSDLFVKNISKKLQAINIQEIAKSALAI